MKNKYECLAAYSRYEQSDLADPEVTKHYENRERIAAILQTVEGELYHGKVARIVAANKSKLKLDANASGDKMSERIQYTQNPEQRLQILFEYFTQNFPAQFPYLEPVYQFYEENGKIEAKTLCPPSHAVLWMVLNAEPTLSKGLITDRVSNLNLNGLLVRKPPVVERIVEVEKKPDPKVEARKKFQEAHDAGLRNSAKHNRTELDDEWNRGKSAPLPLTEEQRVAKNVDNRRIDSVIAETLSTIGNYSAGKNHSRTAERRSELTALFDRHKGKVTDSKSAETLQNTIAEKINSYDKSSGSIR